jgi:hypothetical protein
MSRVAHVWRAHISTDAVDFPNERNARHFQTVTGSKTDYSVSVRLRPLTTQTAFALPGRITVLDAQTTRNVPLGVLERVLPALLGSIHNREWIPCWQSANFLQIGNKKKIIRR